MTGKAGSVFFQLLRQSYLFCISARITPNDAPLTMGHFGVLKHLFQEKSPILAAALLLRMAIAGVAEALLAAGPSPRPLSDLWAPPSPLGYPQLPGLVYLEPLSAPLPSLELSSCKREVKAVPLP